MHARLEYTWWAQRRGFVRNTVRSGLCDVVIGVPAHYELLATTAPYYRSAYVFLSREDRHADVRSFDDPVLRRMRIGVHVIGDDAGNPPPAHALAQRHLTQNLVGFTLLGDYSEPNPPARLVEAAARGDVDVAVAWGPLAGYFAALQPQPMRITIIPGDPALPSMPFAFSMAVGVSRDRPDLLRAIDGFLARNRQAIRAVLDEYHVPQLPLE